MPSLKKSHKRKNDPQIPRLLALATAKSMLPFATGEKTYFFFVLAIA